MPIVVINDAGAEVDVAAIGITPWVSAAFLAESCPGLPPPHTYAEIALATTEQLIGLSGGRFELRRLTVRPQVCGDCSCPPDDYLLALTGGRALLWTGSWWGCRCSGASVILDGPVSAVYEVKVDGVVLDPATYNVVDGHKLVRLDGGTFPCCQRVDRPLGQVGTWSVTYAMGEPVTAAGRLAAAELGCEYVKLFTPGQTCALPERIQSRTAQGITQNFVDPRDLLKDGLVGLRSVDHFLGSLMAEKKRAGGRMVGPRQMRRQVIQS